MHCILFEVISTSVPVGLIA